MKIFFAFTLLLITAAACNKNCKADAAACNESVPISTGADNQCAMLHNRWFYDKDSKTCELKSYGGCSRKGFETKEECETCKCK